MGKLPYHTGSEQLLPTHSKAIGGAKATDISELIPGVKFYFARRVVLVVVHHGSCISGKADIYDIGICARIAAKLRRGVKVPATGVEIDRRVKVMRWRWIAACKIRETGD